jgi:D-galactonate transporter
MNLLARTSFEHATDWRLYNKIAARLMPFLILLYTVSFVDRVNVGFAKLRMAADIGLSDTAFGFGAGVFFIAYCLFEVPSNLILRRVGARFWIARILVVWGVVSAGMMFVSTPLEFYLMRVLLGLAEAGFFPGVILYLTYWFPARQRAQAVSLFLLGIPLAGIFGWPISGWIMQTLDQVGGLHGWQWLFLIEGIPAVLVGIVTFFYLDDGPAQAKWLSPDERARVTVALAEERTLKDQAGRAHTFGRALKDRNLWLLALVDLTQIGGIYGLSFWLPQITHDLGVKGLLNTGLITAIPFLVAAIVMVLAGRHSDRTDERRWHIVVLALVGAAGLVCSGVFATQPVLSLIGLSLASLGLISANAILFAVPGTILSGAAAAAGIGLISMVGNIGGYAFPFVMGWLRGETHHSQYGLFLLAAVTCVGAFAMCCIGKMDVSRGRHRA